MSAEGEELVEAGGFRVDSRRAFEILRRSQLPDDYWRPLLWFRLAAACGARRATLRPELLKVVFEFDGIPILTRLLGEPFGRMTAGDPSPVARWLSWALVHSLEPGVSVTVSSGRGDARAAFQYQVDGTAAPAAPARGTLTRVEVHWSALTFELGNRPSAPWLWLDTDERRVSIPRLGPAQGVPFRLESPLGEIVPWEARKEADSKTLRDGPLRLRVGFGATEPRLTLWHYGVRAHSEALGDFALPAAVDVDDPGLVLNASLTAPVNDDTFWRSMAAGRRAFERFAQTRLRRHAGSMRLTGALLLSQPPLRRVWAATSLLGRVDGTRVPFAARAESLRRMTLGLSPDALRVALDARFCRFLREAALAKLRGTRLDQADPLRAALWRTPLLFAANGQALSLADLALDERTPAVWEEGRPAQAGAGAGVVWALTSADKRFARAFPKRACRVE